MDTKLYPRGYLTETGTWQEGTRKSLKEMLEDPILAELLARSALTRAQFETLLIDQLGQDMANKRLTRNEMARLVRYRDGVSRGAMNRTLRQAKMNASGAIHTILLLGYAGLFDSPSLARFVEVSERLKGQVTALKESGVHNQELYRTSAETLFVNLEEAFQALFKPKRDT